MDNSDAQLTSVKPAGFAANTILEEDVPSFSEEDLYVGFGGKRRSRLSGKFSGCMIEW
jgi:hypothetical protein